MPRYAPPATTRTPVSVPPSTSTRATPKVPCDHGPTVDHPPTHTAAITALATATDASCRRRDPTGPSDPTA